MLLERFVPCERILDPQVNLIHMIPFILAHGFIFYGFTFSIAAHLLESV
jgi:hypothetical protein